MEILLIFSNKAQACRNIAIDLFSVDFYLFNIRSIQKHTCYVYSGITFLFVCLAFLAFTHYRHIFIYSTTDTHLIREFYPSDFSHFLSLWLFFPLGWKHSEKKGEGGVWEKTIHFVFINVSSAWFLYKLRGHNIFDENGIPSKPYWNTIPQHQFYSLFWQCLLFFSFFSIICPFFPICRHF